MSIFFRDQDLLADGIHLNLVTGFNEPVQVRGIDVVVPSRPGRIARNRIADVRKLILEGRVEGNTPEEWRVATDLLMSIIDTTLDPGILELTDGYLGLAPGDDATITARVVNAIGDSIQGGMTFQKWSIELESVDPDWLIGTGS